MDTGENLLAFSQEKFCLGEWSKLADLTPDTIAGHPDRAALAGFAAAGHQQLGHIPETRQWVLQALKWGCPKSTLSRILIAGIHNILGRCAAALRDEPRTNRHFSAALAFLPSSEQKLASESRAFREMSSIGLLADSTKLVDRQIKALQLEMCSPVQIAAQLKILQTQMSLLQHELSIAQQRGQLNNVSPPIQSSAPGPGGMTSQWKAALQGRAVSQLGQELWVLEKLHYKRGGFFVEFGATDGVLLSNTYLLEKEFDWQGICAEPNPHFFSKLKKNRHCVVAEACIGEKTGEKVEFIFADEFGGMARDAAGDMHKEKREAYQCMGQTAELVTISLHDFLLLNNAPRTIDYLSIDTEGSEYSILQAFPFSEWDVRLLTVEHNFTEQRAKIRELLESNGYDCHEEQWDDWYFKKTDGAASA